MKYKSVVDGILNKRLNRFIAEVFLGSRKEHAHIKNTGRLKELLKPGVKVILEEAQEKSKRKTRFSLVAVEKEGSLVNIDSQAPNKVAYEALKNGCLSEIGLVQSIRREVMFGDSRFDLYFERENDEKGFIEVKGVTLVENEIAMFPDAPTSRGTKHVLELAKAVREGYSGTVLFLVQMQGCQAFAPNRNIDEKFADALAEAQREGVQILAYDTIVKKDELIFGKSLPIML